MVLHLDRRLRHENILRYKPVSYLKAHTADILKQISETHRPLVITQNGEPRAVMQDPQSYDKMLKP